MGIWYCTREDVKSALDTKETARNNAQVDRAIESGSRGIEGMCHRRFYPELRTMTWDWPNRQHARSWRLWLDANELISITTMTSGGVVIPAPARFLRPDDGPPFNRVEIDLSSSSAFSAVGTHQRAITITGLYGHRNDEEPAGALASPVDSVAVTVAVTDSAAVGVGSILRVDAERMIVTGKRMLTTGQTLQAPVDAQNKTVTIPVVNGAAFAPDETILLDAERMQIVDITGNSLIVKRGWDGSVLASHTGSTIYAPRTLTVQRGVLGTTAAAHLTAAPNVKHAVPGLVKQLAVAEALNATQQEQAGYARTIGPVGGSSAPRTNATFSGLEMLRSQVFDAYGRKARTRGV